MKCFLALFCVILGNPGLVGDAQAQDVLMDKVSITADRRQIFAITSGEGIARTPLAAGEKVLRTESKGVTGYVQTSTRLLGFSRGRQLWVERRLPASEQILAATVMPRMVVVQGQDSVYGFVSEQARWKREVWGAGEIVRDYAIENHVALFVTNRRAVAFSAKTGGFFAADLPVATLEYQIQINDNVIILHLPLRKLVFRSGLAIWTELP